MELLVAVRDEVVARIDAHRSVQPFTKSPVTAGIITELTWFKGRLDTALAATSSCTPSIRIKPGHGPLPDCLPERTHSWLTHTKGDETDEELRRNWKTCKWCQHTRQMEHGDKVNAGRVKMTESRRAAAEMARVIEEERLAALGIEVDLSGAEG